MKTPNTLESVQPLSGQYSFRTDLRLSGWFFVAALAYMTALALRRWDSGLGGAARLAIALSPLAFGLLSVRSWVRFVRGMDEFQRRLQVQSVLFASLMTLLVGAVFSVLADNGYGWARFNRGLGIGGTFFFLFIFWIAASVYFSRRYK